MHRNADQGELYSTMSETPLAIRFASTLRQYEALMKNTQLQLPVSRFNNIQQEFGFPVRKT